MLRRIPVIIVLVLTRKWVFAHFLGDFFRESGIQHRIMDYKDPVIDCGNSRVNILYALEHCGKYKMSRSQEVAEMCKNTERCTLTTKCRSARRRIDVRYTCIEKTPSTIDDDEGNKSRAK
ncbi:zinc knuckle [Babesia caballi]|uniref:Zinc knuckle n=1 Tax=Babesia caballi TaxID=5871 RepID=A0AAV4LUS8_BABCB|nr:zinc knuckle [Babesia caballi]